MMYKIRECVIEVTSKTIVHALVTSKLDHYNSLLYSLPDVLLNKLWNVQKSAARLITISGKYQHISLTMKTFHWLPIRQHIEYNVLLVTYKALNNLAPVYPSDILQCIVDWGSRRDNTLLLVDPKINRVTYGGEHLLKQLQCSGTASHQASEPVLQLSSSRKILKQISVISVIAGQIMVWAIFHLLPIN